MELKRLFRSAVAVVLAASMLSSISAGAVASVVTTPEYDIEGERLTGEYAPEGNAVYFGANTASVEEEDGLYHVKLYREGDLSGEASVTIRALSISATYGEDYELPDADTVTGQDMTLLQRSAQEPADAEEISATATLLTDDPDGLADGTASVEITDVKAAGAAADTAEKSGLAAEKEAQTGTETREIAESTPVLNGGLSDAVMGALAPAYILGIEYAAEQIVTFAAGEDEQEITFRILDDRASEGTEGFSLMIVDAEGAEPYTNIAFSVTINDNEPVVNSALSFSADSYTLEDDGVTVTVTRTGAEYSIATAVLTAKDEDGNVLTQGEIAFSPYETEQEITLELSEAALLSLDSFTAAEPGDITEAAVGVSRSFFPVFSEEESVSLLTDDDKQSFRISMAGKPYTVSFSKGDTIGTILDESYSPALEVGVYFFPQETSRGGMMTYSYTGNSPGKTGSRSHDFHEDGSRIWAQLEYYSWWTRDKGRSVAGMYLKDSKVEALLYRKLIPDWEQDRTAYGGQKTVLDVCFNKDSFSSNADTWLSISGGSSREFSRRTDAATGIEVKNRTGLITYSAAACDDEKNMTPKVRVYFYGVAALYKKYHVTATNPMAMDFKAGDGTVSAVPVQFRVKCGAQVFGDNQARDLYVNSDVEKSNIVFTLQSNTVNGVTDCFGTLRGYTITVSPDNRDNMVVLSYPADFQKFIHSGRKTINGGADYSATGIAAEEKKILEHLDTIPMDKYFIEWIESVQKATGSDALGYTQDLLIRPVVDYNDVQVSFLAPEGDAASSCYFNNKDYQSGNRQTFHAGDMLDLSGTSDDPFWRVVGYEVSTNGGVTYNAIRDTSALVLEPNKNYLIRPAVSENVNCIEVEFMGRNTAENLSIFNSLIPNSELPAQLKGKYVLNLNPEAATVYEKMRPEVGKAYNLDILVTGTPADSGKVYRPVIRDNMLGRSYNGQRYYFNARSARADNRITVSLETVDTADIQKYSVDGSAMVSLPSIRNDSLGKHSTPAAGYTVFAPSGQGTLKSSAGEIACVLSASSSVNNTKGDFHLSEVAGMAGDRISVLIDNGYNDAQTAEIVLGDDTVCSAGQLAVEYPYSAPRVTSILYGYDTAANMDKVDLRDNSVRAFDDTLTLTAVVDTKGREIEKAVFVISTVSGITRTVEAEATDKNIYKAQIPQMLDSLNNGDRISVYLVDKESRTITVGGSQQEKLAITYPTQETGLVIYVENELIAPKDFTTDSSIPVNIPMIGSAANYTSTGKLTFTRTNWPGNTGYTLMINMGVSNGSTLTLDDKMKAKDGFLAVTKKYTNAKKELNRLDQKAKAQGLSAKQLQDIYTEKGQHYDAIYDAHPSGKFTQEPYVEIHGSCALALDFIYNEKMKEYQVARFGITIGCGVFAMKTWYGVIGYVPCFLNLSGDADISMVFGGDLPAGEKALSESAFSKYSGNLQTLLGTAGFEYQCDIVLMGKLQVGCGLCGVLSARGFVSINLNFQALYGNQSEILKDNFGFLVDFGGGIGFDLVLFSIDMNVARISKGWGTLESVKEISLFDNILQPGTKPSLQAEMASADGTEYVEVTSVTPYSGGTADMSSFGQAASLAAQPQEVSRSVLLENAADRTRPQLLELPDGSAFLLFLGSAGRDEADDSCLYYTVRPAGGSWSTPVPVADNGTYDTMPDAILYDGKVVIAWMDAGMSFAGSDDFIEQFNSFNIVAATYDIDSGTMGEPAKLVSNDYFAGYPSLCAGSGYVDCVYMNRDISGVAEEEEMLDFESTYSTMARVTFDPDRMSESDTAEQYIVISNQKISDPLVTDYSRDSLQVNGRNLFLSAFTVDLDTDLTTVSDREVYLSFYDADNKVDYYPVRISCDSTGKNNPQVTNLGDAGTYVTWMDQNGVFCLLNAGELAEALFADGVSLGDPASPDWYHVAAPADVNEEDYEESIYAELNSDEFRVEKVALAEGEDCAVSVDEYRLATDGTDAYIFFVAPNPGYESTGTDLYGMRYRNAGSDAEGAEKAISGFTTPVAITNDDNVIDEFTIYVTEDRNVELVSNSFTQSVSQKPEGGIDYSPNSLVNISFEPAGSVEIVSGSFETEDYLVPDTQAQVSFTVRNNGLFPAEGWDYTLSYQKGGTTLLDSGSSDVVLEPGSEYTVYTTWLVPDNISGASLAASVSERGVAIATEDRAVITLDSSARLQPAIDSVAFNEDGTLAIATSVRNIGNAASGAYEEVLYDMQDSENPVELYRGTMDSLAAGGSAEAERSITVSAKNFNGFGCLDLKYAVEQNGEELANDVTLFSVQIPVLAAFDTEAESLALEAGKTATVTASAAPWGEIAGDPIYVSENYAVADVDVETGAVTAISAGETVIYAVFPEAGLVAELPVTVTGEKPAPSGGGSSHGNGSVKEDPTAGSNAYKDPTAATTPTAPETPVTPATPETPETGDGTFTDVPASAYYAEPVDWAVEKGITNGTSETTFSPDMTCTRAQTVTFLWRAAGCPVVDDAENPFTDVSEDAYYYNAVLWAVANGITNGTSETTFSPDDTVTRGQTVTFLWRAAEQPEAAAENPFADVAESDYFCNAVLWAVEEGITNGTSETTFSPADGCTRGQIVTFLYRAQ